MISDTSIGMNRLPRPEHHEMGQRIVVDAEKALLALEDAFLMTPGTTDQRFHHHHGRRFCVATSSRFARLFFGHSEQA